MRKYTEMDGNDEFVCAELPDHALRIPGYDREQGSADRLEIWYDHVRGRTYVLGEGEFMGQPIMWCEGVISPEEALADYLEELSEGDDLPAAAVAELKKLRPGWEEPGPV